MSIYFQGTPTEGIAYPCAVTLLIEHSDEYWACMVQIIGHHLGGYQQKVSKEQLQRAGALKVGAIVVLTKVHGRTRLTRAPKDCEEIHLPGELHLTHQQQYPAKVTAQFPKLKCHTNSTLPQAA